MAAAAEAPCLWLQVKVELLLLLLLLIVLLLPGLLRVLAWLLMQLLILPLVLMPSAAGQGQAARRRPQVPGHGQERGHRVRREPFAMLMIAETCGG